MAKFKFGDIVRITNVGVSMFGQFGQIRSERDQYGDYEVKIGRVTASINEDDLEAK